MGDKEFDVLVIGGGIAGIGVAAHLAQSCRVAVLEMEEQPGYHSTGRSAALFVKGFGSPVIRALTLASKPFFFSPDPQFCDGPLVSKRDVMIVGRAEKRQAFEQYTADEIPHGNLVPIDANAAMSLCPVLRAEGLIGALLDGGAADIDVHALQQGFIKQLRSRGGELFLKAKVEAMAFLHAAALWDVRTGQGVFRAPIIVNAAGAWADEIALRAGVRPIGIEPRRRTAALVDIPDGLVSKDWPMVVDADEQFYMKPDAGLLLISPANETPSEPEDAQADELEVAMAAERLEQITSIEVRRIRSKWAGLRSFVGDRSPVVGYDPQASGFFWLAALGGYGIQTAPALTELAARLVLKMPVQQALEAIGIRESDISPSRLSQTADQLAEDQKTQGEITNR